MFYSTVKTLLISVFLLISSAVSAQITITDQPDPAIVCAGTDVILTTVATGDTGLTYQWQRFNPNASAWENITNNTIYSGANAASLLIHTTGGTGGGRYQCMVSGDVFPSVNTNAVTVTVNYVVPPTVLNVNLCIVTVNVALTALGGTNGQYRWYTNVSGGIAIPGETDNTYIIPLLNLTTTMYVSIDDGTCESERVAISANLLSLVPSPTVTNGSACVGSPVTLTAQGGNDGEYRWYTSPSILATPIAGATNANYNTPTNLPPGNTTYYVSLYFGLLCESATRTPVVATVNTIPSSPQPINATSVDLVCGPELVTLSTSGGIEGDYQWYANGLPIAGAVNQSLSITPSTTTLFEVANRNGTCESPRQTVTVIVRTPASDPIVNDDTACRGETVTFNATGAVGNEEYHWFSDSGATSFLAIGSAYTTPPVTISQAYYVRIINAVTGCRSSVHQVNAIMLTPPAPPTVDPFEAVCSGSVATFTAHGASNGQYRWYTESTGGSAVATNNTYTISSFTTNATMYVSINNGNCESDRVAVTGVPTPQLLAPTTTSAVRCGDGSVTLQASGSFDGNYRWYTTETGGLPIELETNSTFVTPALSSGITTYYVSVAVAPCESMRVPVTGTVHTIPNMPTVVSRGSCTPASVTLTALGAADGQYRWYEQPTLGTSPINGQINGTFTTPNLTTSTTYYVSIYNGFCESDRVPVIASIAEPGCINNVGPVIQSTSIVTRIGGQVMLNLEELISDENDDQDFTTLIIMNQPASGAVASIEVVNGIYTLVINYAQIAFSGVENIRIGICDSFSACTLQIFSIEVAGEIEIFNALSPNGDGMNDIFRIDHIATLENTRENKVLIFNRWGDLIWEGKNYDNQTVVFTGKSKDNEDLPSGNYFYTITFATGRKSESGFLSLKR